tara:strand:- start:11124 stop:11357 length:234 start_codon:yes stop_codon:yes gene_type:complete
MKFILYLYLCSQVTGQCPSSTIPGYQFLSHYDCVASGYKLAHNTFISLQELEEFEKDYIETNKIVVKFECRKLGEET